MTGVILIGMPGVGKTFIGRNLAKALSYDYIDIDDEMISFQNKSLIEIIKDIGEEGFLVLEEKIILNLKDLDNKIISTGGSAVYSKKAMNFLKNKGKIIMLDASLETIKKRLDNRETRGIIGIKNKKIEQLYEERQKLYQKYSDVVVNTDNFNLKKILKEIIALIRE